MNIAISLAFTELELAKKQPNSMIVLKSGSAVYAPVLVLEGELEANRQKLINVVNELFDAFLKTSNPKSNLVLPLDSKFMK